ncbi:MAG: hypothetical protein WBF03_01005 [Xanthobacteraceae bacterium]
MPSLVVLCSLALAACDHAPAFDASSLPAYQKSFGEITAQLSAQDQRKLEVALLTLAAGNAADTSALQAANPGSLAVLASLNGVANPQIYLDRLRPKINGRSAAGVIRLVASELDTQISLAESQLAGAEKLLGPVVIEHPRYYWNDGRVQREPSQPTTGVRIVIQSGTGVRVLSKPNAGGRVQSGPPTASKGPGQPTIEFSIYNGSKNVISRIYVSGVLTTHDRPTPWAKGIIIHSFERGLQPGEQVPVVIKATGNNSWTDIRLATLYDADFTLKIINVENTNGERLVPLNLEVLEAMRQKRDALRAS